MADLTRVENEPTYDVLVGHQRAHGRDLGNGTHTAVCTCGLVVVLDWKLDAKSWFVGHQAQMLATAGLLATDTEWGVRWANGQIVGPVTEAEAHAWKSGVPVRREVTEWRPADEKRTSQPAQEATQAPAGRDGGAGTPANTSRVIPEAQGGAQ